MRHIVADITVVCPVYNEELGIHAFYERTVAAMQAITPSLNWQLLFVDDGSEDRTLAIARELAACDSHVGVLALSRNFGHQIAITAGIDHAIGDAVVVIDSDLQDPPEVIADMVAKWREGHDVVYGQRIARAGESRFKKWTAAAYYRTVKSLSDTDLPLDAGDFRLMDRRVVDALKQIREDNRYMRGLVAWVGFQQYALPYARDERFAGVTKYPIRKMVKFAADGVTSFSNKPLRLAMELGILVTVASFVFAIYILMEKVLNPSSSLPGYASMMVAIMFLGGVQLLTIGILGIYLGRTYSEAKNRPLYLIADATNVKATRDV